MALELGDIYYAYGDHAFALSLSELIIEKGEAVALVGPSGSGKTTLLNLISGILSPQRGTLRLNGDCLSDLSQTARRQYRLTRMGMIFQSFELLDYLNVRDNVLLQARLAPDVKVSDALEQQARAVSTKLGLAEKWLRPITSLSQGERQRVAACRALLLDPSLVLADEPTGNLDPDNKHAVLSQLIALCRENQRILLTVTHDHSLLPAFDRVVDIAEILHTEPVSA